jgi:phospholipase C
VRTEGARRAVGGIGVALLLVVFGSSVGLRTEGPQQVAVAASVGVVARDKIKHVVVIMQENRSFDSYFGPYHAQPYAGSAQTVDGFPSPLPCIPDPGETTSGPSPSTACVQPYESTSDVSRGFRHQANDALADIDHFRMDGFIATARAEEKSPVSADSDRTELAHQTMAYHIGSAPNGQLLAYWTMANDYVLQDHLFSSVPSWSDPTHNYMVSAWSAACPGAHPLACTNLDDPLKISQATATKYTWNSIVPLLDAAHISWSYYADPTTPSIWSPLKNFADVKGDPRATKTYPAQFDQDIRAGTLPSVVWVAPSFVNSEHPPASIYRGESYVAALINKIGTNQHLWDSTAIFLSWDDWGGFYDHAKPPAPANPDPSVPKPAFKGDDPGYGIRVPGLVISAWAKSGWVDHQYLSHDAYLKFVEDVFLPSHAPISADDHRPDIRESIVPGDILCRGDPSCSDFDFGMPRPRAFTPIRLPAPPVNQPAPSSQDIASAVQGLAD